MKMMNKIAILIVVGVLSLAGLILFGYKKIASKDDVENLVVEYEVVNQWELPEILDEVSGIDWIGEHSLACIQDEDGVVFIFNLQNSEIERRIEFGGPGDYEDIRIVGNTAYILRSDGEVFEVSNVLSGKPETKVHSTFLSAKQNLESLAYDAENERLLLAIKDKEPKDNSYKGIYEFSLASKVLNETPAFRLQMQDSLFPRKNTKLNKQLQPSALGIHPNTGKYYILDGRSPQLIIADKKMNLEKRYALKNSDFAQAEGLTFSEDGRLFISNEAKGAKANILEVVLK